MTLSQKTLILVGCLAAMLLSLASTWNSHRELQSARQQLLSVLEANNTLRKTLGEMTLAITAKDKEIDRLLRSSCSSPQKTPPPVPPRPDRAGDN